jgi:crotonobetainyl-CoA:carnitine CoA-transferase CaiB-like acyl-CoA transferase
MTDTHQPQGALDGVKVVEIAQHYAVPYCGQLLSDLGALVVKVEAPSGDAARHYVSHVPFESKAFAVINRGKRSVCVDLARPGEARPAVEALVRWADVVLVSFKPTDVPRYRLTYEELSEINPRVVYLQHVPFGPAGPMGDDGGFDPLAQALSGLSFLTARAEHGVPMNVRPAYNDAGVGMVSALGVVAALRHRDLTGEGQRVETHLLSTALTFTQAIIHNFAEVDPPRFSAFDEELAALRASGADFEAQRLLYDDTVLSGRHLLRMYFRNWETSDGLVAAAPLSPPLQGKFHAATGLPDPRREGWAAGSADWDALVEKAEALFRTETTATWLVRLRAAGVPCAPYNLPNDVFEDPQIRANGFLVDLDHPLLGRYTTTAPPIRMSRTPTRAQGPSPVLGADTDDVLRTVGMPDDLLEELLASGAVGSRLDTRPSTS